MSISTEIILYLPDTLSCNSFINKLETSGIDYILIGQKKWKKSTSYKHALEVHWLEDDAFNFHSIKKIIKKITSSYDKRKRFRLVSFHEMHVELGGNLVEELNILGISKKQSILFRDKFKMIQAVKKIGILAPKTYILSDINSFFSNNFSSSKGYIFKPRKSYGSKGVIFLKTKKQCFDWYKNNLPISDDYLIQEFIFGKVYHIDGVIWKNKTQIYFCGENLLSHINVGKTFKSFKKNILISKKSAISKKLFELHEQVRNCFSFQEGCTHIEFFIEGEDIIFCEAAARPPASHLLKLHKYQYGKDAIEIFSECLGKKEENLAIQDKELMIPGLISFTPEGRVSTSTKIESFHYEWILEKQQTDNISNVKGGSYLSELGKIYIRSEERNQCIERLELLSNFFNYKLFKE